MKRRGILAALLGFVLLVVNAPAFGAVESDMRTVPFRAYGAVERQLPAGQNEAFGSNAEVQPAPTSGGVSSAGSVGIAAAHDLFSYGWETTPVQFLPLGGGDAPWGMTTYRRSEGSWSVYCAAGYIQPPGPYPSNMSGWIVAGPFDLSDYTSATFAFDLWAQCESDYDFFYAGASSDNVNYSLIAYSGDSYGWTTEYIDVSAYCGDPQVWICFGFESDESYEYEGVYVDKASLYGNRTEYAPVASADTYYTHVNTAKTENVLSNDVDANHDPLAANMVAGPSYGGLVLNSNGSFTYTPNTGFSGTDTFTYQASDGLLSSNTTLVTINVGNAAPIAGDDAFSTPMNQWCGGYVLNNDSDPESDMVTVSKLTDPLHGTLEFDAYGNFIYYPATGWSGVDSFTYELSDGTLTDVGTVTITVIAPLNPVFRFYNVTNGTHFFTPSADECNMVMATWPNIFRFEGPCYYTNPNNNTQPLYRFYNRNSSSHFYTASPQEAAMILATWPNIFNLDGQTYSVNPGQVPNSIPVFRFYNVRNGSHFYTASAGERDLVNAQWSNVYRFEGICFWLGQ